MLIDYFEVEITNKYCLVKDRYDLCKKLYILQVAKQKGKHKKNGNVNVFKISNKSELLCYRHNEKNSSTTCPSINETCFHSKTKDISKKSRKKPLKRKSLQVLSIL